MSITLVGTKIDVQTNCFVDDQAHHEKYHSASHIKLAFLGSLSYSQNSNFDFFDFDQHLNILEAMLI